MATTPKGRKTTASKTGTTAAKTTTPRKKPARKATSSSTPSANGKRTAGTRTSTRSAKRRSPKEGQQEDPAQIELERTEFLRAMDKYKRKTGKTFPTWTEVLEVIRGIGWLHPMRVQQELDDQQRGLPRS